jgi:transcriptional regulator with XRE-family HTH domain
MQPSTLQDCGGDQSGSVIGLAAGRSKVNEAPEVSRRRVRGALRQARKTAKLTQVDAAKALDWHVSKIIRIEQGAVWITPVDLRALLGVYGITDDDQVETLVELARSSRSQSWGEYKGVYSPESLTLFASESAAKIIYKYEPTFIPGLLQTGEYATALLEGMGRSEDETERMVSARLERQELLESVPRPELQFVLGEAAVSRAVGGPAVMRRQLERLKELSRRPDIFLQVLQFSSGAHRHMGDAFTILEFADASLDDLLYLENAGGESVSREKPELIADYLRDFITIQEIATKPDDFVGAIDEIIAARFAASIHDSTPGTNGLGQPNNSS